MSQNPAIREAVVKGGAIAAVVRLAKVPDERIRLDCAKVYTLKHQVTMKKCLMMMLCSPKAAWIRNPGNDVCCVRNIS